MKIGIDVTFLGRDRRGMGRVTRSVIEKFLKKYEHRFYFILTKFKSDAKTIQSMFPDYDLRFLTLKDPKINTLDVVWYPWNRIDFVPECRKVVTIHDVAPYRFSNCQRGCEGFKDRKRIKAAAELADRIITPTEFSRSEISTFLEIPQSKIVVIHHGIEPNFCKKEIGRDDASQFINRMSKGFPYVLFVGNVEKRKNVEILLDGFGIAKRKYTFPHKLIIAGECPRVLQNGNDESSWTKILTKLGVTDKLKKNSLLTLLEKLSIKDDVIWLGEVAEDDLVNLYNLAKLFVFPSQYEGFGLPILEAMSCGVPCVVSKIPSVIEVAGDAAMFFDAKDSEALADSIWQVISDSDLSNLLIKSGINRSARFKWEDASAKLMKVLEGR